MASKSPNNAPRKSSAWLAVFAVYVASLVALQVFNNTPEFEYLTKVIGLVWISAIVVGAFLPFIIKRDMSDILGLKNFLEENGLTFDVKKDEVRSGMIFNRGRNRTFRTLFEGSAQNGRLIEVANYTYVIGVGKNRREETWGFIRIELSRQLPRMVIDGRRNNFITTNLPEIFDESQLLQLEGNFSDVFDVYVPAGYENDALYILTPDVMALILDKADGFDIEITGGQLFVYAEGGFDIRDASSTGNLVELAKEFQHEFETQADYYADERVGSRRVNSIAKPGRTLRSGVNWTGLFMLIVVLYYMNGGIFPVPDWVNLLLMFVVFGGVLFVVVREIRRLKKIRK